MLEALSFPFFQKALLAGMLVGVMCGYYGVFVVQRGLSFLGDGLAHAAFGGVALALLLGWSPLYVALPFAVLVAVGMTYVRQRTELGADTTIGIFFAVSAALGVLFLGLKRDFTVDPFAYLFGSILGVTTSDLWVVVALGVAAAALVPWTWRGLAYATFDTELARADGVPTRALEYFLAVMVAATVVVSVKVVGVVLVASYLIIPAATARLASRTLYRMTLTSVLLGLGCSLAGLFVSYAVEVPSGATIVLTQALVFAMVAVWSGARAGR